jgi:hypothetical protein
VATVWLSGRIQTFLNKVVFPIILLVVAAGLPLWVIATTGRLSIAREFYFVVAFALVASVLSVRLAGRIYTVGYAGRDLVLSDNGRETRIPFEQIESINRVWWYRGEMIRIVFRSGTPFGGSVYYLPKWGPLRWFSASPVRELRNIIAG